jgi:hypothetical protein
VPLHCTSVVAAKGAAVRERCDGVVTETSPTLVLPRPPLAHAFRGKNRYARYQTAAGSAREALACIETAQALGWVGELDPEVAALFRRVIWDIGEAGEAKGVKGCRAPPGK